MKKKTVFVDIQELNEYVEEVCKGSVMLTREELVELYNYVYNNILISPKDKIQLIDAITQISK